MTLSPEYRNTCALIPIRLYDSSEADELMQQRIVCGWNNTPEHLKLWRSQSDSGQRQLLWITVPSGNGTELRAGHISLDTLAKSPEPEFQNTDKSILAINTFFIHPEYRALGLGRKSMDLIEDLATREPHGSPNCKAVIVDTLSPVNFTEPDRLAALWKCFPEAMKRGSSSNSPWYSRRGYVKVKETLGYPATAADGEDYVFPIFWLKKDL